MNHPPSGSSDLIRGFIAASRVRQVVVQGGDPGVGVASIMVERCLDQIAMELLALPSFRHNPAPLLVQLVEAGVASELRRTHVRMLRSMKINCE